MAFLLSHSRIGFCWWDLVALVALVVVIVIFVVNHRKMKDKEKELEEAVSGVYAKDTLSNDKKA